MRIDFVTMGYLIAFIICLIGNHARVFAYSTGASVLECETMSPGLCHGGVAQSGPHGYTIEFVASTGFYGNGDSYQVQISGVLNGLLCQARATQSNSIVGAMSIESATPGVNTLACPRSDFDLFPPQNAVTNLFLGQKDGVVFTWIPPVEDIGAIKMRCTIFKDTNTYWEDIKSEGLTFNPNPPPPTTTTTTTTTTSTPSTTTTTPTTTTTTPSTTKTTPTITITAPFTTTTTPITTTTTPTTPTTTLTTTTTTPTSTRTTTITTTPTTTPTIPSTSTTSINGDSDALTDPTDTSMTHSNADDGDNDESEGILQKIIRLLLLLVSAVIGLFVESEES